MRKYSLEISAIPRLFRRIFEILPGALSWSMLAVFIFLSFAQPITAAYLLIAFDLYWLFKASAVSARLVQGYVRLHQGESVDWAKRLLDLNDIDSTIDNLKNNRSTKFSLDYENKRYLQYLQEVKNNQQDFIPVKDVINAVIVATYNESLEVLEPTIQSIIDTDYDVKNKLILAIAYEQRGGPQTKETVEFLLNKYKSSFKYAVAYEHPANMKNEIIGKGPNITFAGKKLLELIDEKKIARNNVVVTTLDADNRPSKQYFSYLTFMYTTSVNRLKQSYQPVGMFYNNIWDAPAAMRVVAAGNSFWNISLTTRHHLLRNFAAHSQGLESLVETNFWSKESIVEDGHQFWRSYFTFGDDYEVVPLYTPVYQDAVLASTYWRTIKTQFKQIRRWTWGASDIAYVAYFGLKDKTINTADKIAKFVRLLETHVTWATAPLILAFMAWAPLFLNPSSNQNIVVHQLPIVVSRIQTVTTMGLIVTVIISLISLPPRPKRYKKSRGVAMLFQWLLFPITTIVFGSIAALNSQTRLIFGKYITEFEVTEKAVKK